MHTLKRHTFWMSLAIWISCVISASAQNLVLNGGFDTSAAGWTAVNNQAGGYRSSKGNPGGFFVLDATPSVLTDPTVSQTVSGLIQGLSYEVSGDYAKQIDRGGQFPTGLSFGVAIDGVFLHEAPQSDWAWHSFDFIFSATSPSVTLSISTQRNGTGVAYGIDNIALQAVPEPASLSLFGFGALLWLCRKLR